MARWHIAQVAIGAARVAAAEPEPIRIEYRAPAECIAQPELVARLAERAPIRPIDSGDARTFTLTIEPDEGGFRGSLTVRDRDGTVGNRAVSAATCDEVVTALVLVAALAIEEREPAPIAAPTAILVPAVAEAPAPPHDTPWRIAAGAGVAMYSGMTPTPRVGLPLYLAVRAGHHEVRATFDATTSDDLPMASFRWTAGRIEACPYLWELGRFVVGPCGGVQIGALTGTGMVAAEATSDTRPWVAPEAVGRAAVHFGRAALELEGVAGAPLVRDRYYIAPSTTVHEVPAIAYGVAASIAIEVR